MALQVWLPLTKDLRNQGLSNVTVTNNGATFNSAGKLGGCYIFDGVDDAISIGNLSALVETNFSFACWFYHNDTWSTKNYETILGGPSGFELEAKNGSTNSPVIKAYSWGGGSFTYELNKWNHLVMTRTSSETKFYLNGELKLTGTVGSIPSGDYFVGAWKTSTSQNYKGNICDVRIYNHCLSLMEIKKLSQGLVLHYPLSDDSIQQLSNVYNYPTFETTATTGGWSHWGPSGHSGNYGQSTDKNYIYRKTQTYAHWVSENAGTSSYYLLYQSPSFSGGYRSLQCICKEENGLPITEAICYPGWNARNGGVPADKWTSIIPLENDFYLCKCEGISQDGSNNLIGFHVKPGHKVYFSEAYVENDRECCSDIFYPTNITYDTSGFCNNGTIVGTFTISSDTPKYLVSSVYTGSNYIYLDPPSTEIQTIAVWVKWNTIPSGQSVILVDNGSGIGLGLMSTGILCSTSKAGNSYTFSKANLVANTWYHFVVVKTGATTRKLYINGVEQTATTNTSNWTYSVNQLQLGKRSTTSDGFVGKLCDFRAYATALSASDVKSLYQNCATIDPDGTIHGQIRN